MATIRQIQGLDKLKAKLTDLPEEVENEIKLAVLDSATQIELDAIREAPIGIKQLIDKSSYNNGFAAEVGVVGLTFHGPALPEELRHLETRNSTSNLIPIYVEFGTGSSAAQYVPTLPAEIQAVARQYYINGQGTIKKQPYLIPAFLKEAPKFVEELKKILKDSVK